MDDGGWMYGRVDQFWSNTVHFLPPKYGSNYYIIFYIMELLNGTHFVATPLWPSVGVKPNTWKSWGFGVLRDSRMFRARQQGEKHLALGCSWCHWKGLETYISKMPSHWQFGHLQPKLWAKEGPGVKLVV
jgi:hypothetical protein